MLGLDNKILTKKGKERKERRREEKERRIHKAPTAQRDPFSREHPRVVLLIGIQNMKWHEVLQAP